MFVRDTMPPLWAMILIEKMGAADSRLSVERIDLLGMKRPNSWV